MPSLVNITQEKPDAVQIWGFKGTCNTSLIRVSVNTIVGQLTGTNNTLHIMSGTHGCCSGKIGAVIPSFREQGFVDADGRIAATITQQTEDGHDVNILVHDFNTQVAGEEATDPVTLSMSRLNSVMRTVIVNGHTNTFLLAYCCSAGNES